MISVIYGTLNGTQDSIAWWLNSHNEVGPQIYSGGSTRGPTWIGSGTDPWEGKPSDYSPLILDNSRHIDEYMECHRRMENIRGDIIEPMRKFEKDYDMLIWSNFFGELKYADQKIECDKLIICEESKEEDAFHYMMNHAFRTIEEEDIEQHSKVWWTDHKLVDGNITDQWKDIWYKKYQPQMYDAFHKGDLKYMWQLNFMHWDLNNYIRGDDKEPQLKEPDDYFAVLDDKLSIDVGNSSKITYEANPSALYIKDHRASWIDQIDEITDFLLPGKVWNYKLLDQYKSAYNTRRNWFDKLLQQHNSRKESN